jgi:hypothetical protein
MALTVPALLRHTTGSTAQACCANEAKSAIDIPKKSVFIIISKSNLKWAAGSTEE